MPSKKLLVADDSLTIQKVIRLALSNEPYDIQTVSEGTDAVQQISLFHPDAVLIDVSLPGKSAFEVKAEINQMEDLGQVRFILMSSAFETVDEIQAEQVGFHGRLTKPFDPALLRQVLSEALNEVTAKKTEKTAIFQVPPKPAFPDVPPPLPGEGIPIFPPLSAVAPPALPEETTSEIPPLPPALESEWTGSIEPEGVPTLPPPPTENLGTLWDPNQDPSLSLEIPSSEQPSPEEDPSLSGLPVPPSWTNEPTNTGFTPPPLPETLPPKAPDETDIKELTESTIRMSGLEDYQWTVNEPSAKPPAMLPKEDETSSFEVPPPPVQIPRLEENMPTTAPPAPPTFTPPLPEFTPPPPPSQAFTPPPSGPSPEEVQALVRDQVEAMLQEMANKMLPEIAERLIKQEIHKILSE